MEVTTGLGINWGLNGMADILQMTFWRASFFFTVIVFIQVYSGSFKFHGILFAVIQLISSQHCFRYWLEKPLPEWMMTQFADTYVLPMASFTNAVNPRLAKRPLIFNGRLANRGLTSLVKEATGLDELTWDCVIGNIAWSLEGVLLYPNDTTVFAISWSCSPCHVCIY